MSQDYSMWGSSRRPSLSFSHILNQQVISLVLPIFSSLHAPHSLFFLPFIPSSFLCFSKSVQISYYNSLITSTCISHCLFPWHHLENVLYSIIISIHMTFFLPNKHLKFRVFVFLQYTLNILFLDFCLVDYLFIICGLILSLSSHGDLIWFFFPSFIDI